MEVSGLTIEAREIETATTKFPMHVSLAPAVDGSLTGRSSMPRAFSILRAPTRLPTAVEVLTSIAEDVPVLVSDLAVGAAPSWTAAEVDSSRTLTEIFAATAARFPNNIALDDGHRTVTYAELDSASDAQAWELVAREQDRVPCTRFRRYGLSRTWSECWRSRKRARHSYRSTPTCRRHV
ncbi:hypothetical protein ACETU7_06665 [Rhodococcus sp. 3Y1]